MSREQAWERIKLIAEGLLQEQRAELTSNNQQHAALWLGIGDVMPTAISACRCKTVSNVHFDHG